jgi:hypothetical protein
MSVSRRLIRTSQSVCAARRMDVRFGVSAPLRSYPKRTAAKGRKGGIAKILLSMIKLHMMTLGSF